MKEVKLRMKENYKYEIIKDHVDHKRKKTRTALKLGLSIRQVERLIKQYKETGKSSFVHGNRGQKPTKALDKSVSDNIILLYRNKYQGFNFKHFQEYLINEENIVVSYKFIYKHLNDVGIISPKERKKTKRTFKRKLLEKQKLLENKSDEEIDIIVNNEIAIEDSHPRQERSKYFGELIEMDGSLHLWFGENKACLHLAADKCTNTIVGAYFDNQETLNGYYHVYKQILMTYGIPYQFKTDNRTVFIYKNLNLNKRTEEKDVLTQFGYSCDILGTSIITTSIPQSKGLIERDNGTFQDRLVNELRLNGITTIKEANKYLVNIFIKKFNNNFSLDYTKFKSVFELSPTEEIINQTLSIRALRKIDNGNSIKYKNEYYQPYLNNELKCFKNKTEVMVVKSFDNNLLVSIDDKIYELRKLKSHKLYSEEFDDKQVVIKEKQKYIPPMSHPWKAASFKKQMGKAHTNHVYA